MTYCLEHNMTHKRVDILEVDSIKPDMALRLSQVDFDRSHSYRFTSIKV